jgi:purine-binding chemotaxis protein CheW
MATSREPEAAATGAAALAEFLASDEDAGLTLATAGEGGADPRVELLVFTLGSESYALPVPSLREIVRPPPLSEVPRADPAVLGVTMLRGEVVPVIDPRPRLGLGERPVTTSHSRVIIAQVTSGAVGLWVDSVKQVVRMLTSQLEVPPRGVGGDPGALVSLGRAGGTLFGVLDLSALVGGARGAGA